MPVHVEKRRGKKPWAIVEDATGRVVGRSETRRDAMISASYRNRAYAEKHGAKRKRTK